MGQREKFEEWFGLALETYGRSKQLISLMENDSKLH